MTKNMLIISLIFLVGLGGCWGGKKTTRVQHKKTLAQVDISRQDGKSTGFFDENLEDIESFVLDQESPENKALTLANNDELNEVNFTIDEPKQEPGLETHVVYFDYDSTHLRNDQKEKVNAVMAKIDQWIKQGYQVVFKGHSCKWHGARAYNLALSNQRAQCMADMCKTSKNIKIFGVGNEEPVVFENTMQGQAPNRRVEIYPIAA